MTDLSTRQAFAAASVALRYPEREWLQTFKILGTQKSIFPPHFARAIDDLIAYFNSSTLLQLQTEYVASFDRKRRACLYLSYFLNGDTRKRGMALLRFKSAYAMDGWKSQSDELDDFLPMVLEFAAVSDSQIGMDLLREHKSGLILLKFALRDLESPYAPLVTSLCELVPGDVAEKSFELISSGPPVEEVGLKGYGQLNIIQTEKMETL